MPFSQKNENSSHNPTYMRFFLLINLAKERTFRIMMNQFRPKQVDSSLFLPLPARIFAILQLCLSLSVLLFYLAQPFMGQLFEAKSRLLLWNYVLEASADFPLIDQERIKIEAARDLDEAKLNDRFAKRFEKSLQLVAFQLPPFERAWLVLSLILPILLLKRVEGARYAVWLVPLSILCFAIDHRLQESASHQAALAYPSEKELEERYLGAPIAGSLQEQRDLLEKGWQLYLIDQWTKQTPSEDQQVYQKQVKQGEWAFQKERALQLIERKEEKGQAVLSLFMLGIYLFWNVLFAVVSTRASASS